ncbi:MAG: amino acid ABC transporter permease [Solobacterium sp.]|jgi:polar amino acid transport system permease protein|nr:amino acid ABC transporter permease [Solobacterium sp.]MCH4221959.1 amino acid ABC transporter permease [Solobacterium sp.]MCH4265564.1 amino acid ABC transporter permease [Solobacterium sp.]
MDVSVFFTWDNFFILLKGAGMSLGIASISVCCGILLGIVVALCKLSGNKVLRVIGNIYVELIRGTPMLLQILFFFLGVPSLYYMITGSSIRMNIYLCGIVSLSINSGAYMAELIRSSIQAVDKGQSEAGYTLGLSHQQILRFIVLPQAMRRIIPPFVSEFITLIKDSSLLGSIGVIELLQAARNIGNVYYNFLIPLLMATVLYLCMTVSISRLSNHLEKRLLIHD